MQDVSKQYKQSMNKPYRNLGYINVYIGVINSEAQKHVGAADSRNQFTYYSDAGAPFIGEAIDHIYATAEQNFSLADGVKYFLPPDADKVIFSQGIVTEDLLGTVYISFGGVTGLDIKGLTIDFGECYPTDFVVENDQGIRSYNNNDKSYWSTQDVFRGTSYFKITPSRMVNGQGRLRIHQFVCGIANTFTDKQVINYSMKEHVSPITDSLPSWDISLTVNNYDGYYNPDNPDSALAFMEIGQAVSVKFGYELDSGEIEWLPPQNSYLKSWSADEEKAKFTATDVFDYLDGTYRRGRYMPQGTSLYELAEDVFQDAGVEVYYLDPYLKKVIVYNPIPVMKHTEALQMIANAGRCSLMQGRDGTIQIRSSFIPDMVVSSNGETEYSHVSKVLKDEKKDAYGLQSKDFPLADGSLYFMPVNQDYYNTGYISSDIADENGIFPVLPTITIGLEAAFVAYGLLIRFRNVAPEEFRVITYNEGVKVDEWSVTEPGLVYETQKQIKLFNRMEIVFTKGHPNSRVTVDNILIGDVTDYTLSFGGGMMISATGKRTDKIQKISVKRTIYRENKENKELKSEEISVSPENPEYTVYFTAASYDLAVTVVDNENVGCQIVDSSNYYAVLRFSGLTAETIVKYSLTGREYLSDENYYTVQHNQSGKVVEWKNALISTTEQAKDLQEWLAEYYLGDVEYVLKTRGDPRIDAHDLFYLAQDDRENPMIRGYENTLKYSGSWSGQMKARKVVLHNGNRTG